MPARRINEYRIGLLFSFFIALLTGCNPETPVQEISSSNQHLSFYLLGMPAAYRDSGYHSALWDLQLWHERIYLAHGDWYLNTGPLRMLYYDVKTGEFIHDDGFVVNEHGMEVFRVYEDMLILPGTETTGREAAGGVELSSLYLKRWDDPWVRLHTIPSAVHIWDIAILDDVLFAVGQKGNVGGLWISTDNGQSWEEGINFQAEGYAMPMSGFVLRDTLYVPTVGTGCIVFDGHSWTSSDCLESNIFEGTAAVQKHAIFQDVVAMAPYWATSDDRVHFFDGQSRWMVKFSLPVHDVISAEGLLFVLTGEPSGLGAIYASQSLDCRCEGDFSLITDLDFQDETIIQEEDEFMRLMVGSTPHSLEFIAGQFYVGLADGRFFQSSPFQP